MRSKFVAIWLISLVTWNAVFGTVGGLLLCFHEDLDIHPELIVERGAKCSSEQLCGDTEITCSSASDPCFDIELEAFALPEVRIQEDQLFSDIPIACNSLPGMDIPKFSLSDVAHEEQPQAPPESIETSILVARRIYLRL